ncbi:uncharacterized protein [Acropora muricata]|uniref:uncharacterized protein isoform X2 n=1 Tax=Acropora muricata TaxID=159855 RepID=UPI0034E4015D
MKFVAVIGVLVVFCLLPIVDAASVSLSSSQLSLNGNRFPIINSGDTIALRSAYPSGSYSKYWLYCITSYCIYTTCPGTIMTASKWSSCSGHMKFVIRAKNKMDGQPINSGDTVSIISTAYGSQYRIMCSTSTSYKCRFVSTTSSFTGNAWLTYSYATFQIFSRNAVDGTPVQFGDIVAFKYPYGATSTWLYYSSYFYARSCSSNNKYSCATQNTSTGFKIFKKL